MYKIRLPEIRVYNIYELIRSKLTLLTGDVAKVRLRILSWIVATLIVGEEMVGGDCTDNATASFSRAGDCAVLLCDCLLLSRLVALECWCRCAAADEAVVEADEELEGGVSPALNDDVSIESLMSEPEELRLLKLLVLYLDV